MFWLTGVSDRLAEEPEGGSITVTESSLSSSSQLRSLYSFQIFLSSSRSRFSRCCWSRSRAFQLARTSTGSSVLNCTFTGGFTSSCSSDGSFGSNVTSSFERESSAEWTESRDCSGGSIMNGCGP